MNKLFNKVAVAFVGIAMAIGVGVAVGINQKGVVPAQAASTGSYVLTFDQKPNKDGTGSSATADASTALTTSNFATYGTYSYSNSGTKYWFLNGYSNIDSVSRVEKIFPGKNSTLKCGTRSANGELTFTVKGNSNLAITSVVINCVSDYNKSNSSKITISEATNSTKEQTISDTNSHELTFTYASAVKTFTMVVNGGTSNRSVVYISQITINYSTATLVSGISLSGTGLGGTSTAATLSISSSDTSSHTIYATINNADNKALVVTKTEGDNLVTIGGLTDGKITASGSPVKASFTVTGKELSSGTDEVITITPDDGTSVSATLTISVFDGSAPIMQSITVGGTATKPTQYPGFVFDPEGLTFTPVYDKENPSPDTITGSDIVWNTLVAGQAVTGTYAASTGDILVTVPTEKVAISGSISVTEVTGTAMAELGGSWDLSGLTLHQYYDSGKNYEKTLVKGTDYTLATSDDIVMGKTSITVTDSSSKIAGSWSAAAIVSSKKNYVKEFSIGSSTVVNDNAYATYTYDEDGDEEDDWIVTFGGYSRSVGTNSNNRSSCNLGNTYSKYAADTGVETTAVASAFASLHSISEKIGRVSYTIDGGSNHSSTKVYLIYSANGSSWTKAPLSSGTQGAAIDTANEYYFTLSSSVENYYFGLLFEATNDAGNWRIDYVTISFYSVETDEEVVDNFVSTKMKMDQYVGDNTYNEARCTENYEAARDAFNELSDSQRDLFLTYSKYSDAKARLLAWATGYGESLNGNNKLGAARINSDFAIISESESSTTLIIVAVSFVSLTAIGGFFLLKKRKENI